MSGPIFKKDGNGHIRYTDYFNGWRRNRLKDKIEGKHIYGGLIEYTLKGNESTLGFDQGNKKFDQSDYHQGLGLNFGNWDSSMNHGGQYYDELVQLGKKFYQFWGVDRFSSNPDTEAYHSEAHMIGIAVEFLDASSDGIFDGNIDASAINELKAGKTYTHADFAKARNIIQQGQHDLTVVRRSDRTNRIQKKKSTQGKGFQTLLLMAALFLGVNALTKE